MSLTSRVQRLITGPTPSVGSDDWPSRYIWRWICRRSAVATSVAARATTVRRQIETTTISTSRISPIASRVPSAPRLFRKVGRTLDQADQRPGPDPMHRVGARDAVGDQRDRSPCRRRDEVPIRPRSMRASHATAGRRSTRLGREPRLAPRGHQGHEQAHDPQQRHDQQRLDGAQDPRDHRIATGAQERPSPTIRDGLHG